MLDRQCTAGTGRTSSPGAHDLRPRGPAGRPTGPRVLDDAEMVNVLDV